MSKYKTNWQLDETVLPEDMNRIEENIKENSNTFTEFKKEYDSNSTQKDEKIKLKAAKEEVVLKIEPPKDRDCNSFKQVNVFCVFDTGTGDFKNTPEGTLAYGSARVFLLINRGLNTNRIQQEFINIFPENNITRWVRNYNGDSVVKWGNWYKVYDGANKPTLSELNAASVNHNHDNTYLGKKDKAESSKSADSVEWDNVNSKPQNFPPSQHNHDERYLGKNAKAVDSDKLRGWLLSESNTNYRGIPFVGYDGVVELGHILDFHIPNSQEDYDIRIEAIRGCLKFWQDISALNVWARKYLRINDWYGGAQDGRMYYKESDKGLYTENVEDFFVQGGAVARGKYERIGNADIYHIGGGIRLVRQVITTGASNSGGGANYTIHFPKVWGWVQPLALISHNMNNASANTSGYCTIDTWSTTYLNGGCYSMVAGKPTQIILTYLAGE
ncbi:hypothetical protein [Clostridium perfringens]|uniref:hypothetical protein n=1 Tax=Clostridium perfringens TaxID=1502 RepID=UPI003B019AEC